MEEMELKNKMRDMSILIENSFHNIILNTIKLAQEFDKMSVEELKERSIKTEELSLKEYSLETITENPSIDTQITNLKSQLKHCKNPLQKLNMEREMNRLIKEGINNEERFN